MLILISVIHLASLCGILAFVSTLSSAAGASPTISGGRTFSSAASCALRCLMCEPQEALSLFLLISTSTILYLLACRLPTSFSQVHSKS